jgi:predicted metal-dependent enzyme (double-stranded beta helix superfamily)
MKNIDKILQKDQGQFKSFIESMNLLVSSTDIESEILPQAKSYLKKLIADDAWLPDDCVQPNADKYAQHLLYKDPLNRYSVVSFVWGPGQHTPIHNHTVWGLIGMLKGAELCDEFHFVDGNIKPQGMSHILKQGQIEAVSPTVGDWHKVANHIEQESSVSIQIYGGDIGTIKRHMLNEKGEVVDFISGYSTV